MISGILGTIRDAALPKIGEREVTMTRRRLPIGIQTFRTIREDGCYYVDKTAHIRRLLDEGKHYFLSRPRRFGKSLFLDTCKELFEGNEALFEGLAVHDQWDWSVRHPVVRLSFGSGSFTAPGDVQARTREQLAAIERREEVVSECGTEAGRLASLLETLHERTGQRVAVLVDEYDKPILDALDVPEVARANRDYLRGLYAVIKDSDAHIRFSFLTGVSKFSKANLFSGLNNLTDITLDPRYSAICGYTDADIDTVFAPELPGLDRDRIREWYHGYWWLGEEKVYNPFDILLLFRNRKFGAWWFETGTPAFLVETLFRRRVSSVALGEMVGTDALLSSFDVGDIAPEALLFQTGYLTIREERSLGGKALYRLGYPNREVRQSLNRVPARSTWYATTSRRRRRTQHPARPSCSRRTTSRGCGRSFTPSSRASPTSGTPATTSRATRASTRACSTRTSPRWGSTSRSRTARATGASTWRCASTRTCTCSSSRWWRWPGKERPWRS